MFKKALPLLCEQLCMFLFKFPSIDLQINDLLIMFHLAN